MAADGAPVKASAAIAEIENRARLARTTCGWRKPGLPLEVVRRYWRDVHSLAIARRAGIYHYRHSPFDPVRVDLLEPIEGIEYHCPPAEQLQWQSDVAYLDETGLEAFFQSPSSEHVRRQLLADIELIVDRSTTYKAVGENVRTYVDLTGDPTPQGPPPRPRFGLFFRQRSSEAEFRRALRALAERWSRRPGVLRLRLSLFDRPDMEAERRAGYPVKTHPVAQQYQGWVDLVLEDEAVAGTLLEPDRDRGHAQAISAIHAYPVPAVYTFVYAGRPTVVGLRGYPAYDAIAGLGGTNQTDQELLEWMYGPIVHGAIPRRTEG